MSDSKQVMVKTNRAILPTLGWLAGGVILVGAFLMGTVFLQIPFGNLAAGLSQRLLATDSVQTMWYITRSAGLTSYLLLWLSMAWGLAVSSKILDRILHRSFTYDFHQFISLLAVGFAILHVVVLLFDRYLPYSVAQILVPFLSPYRPVWVGIGIIGMYLTLLVTVTFYLRGRIGMKAFRSIHMLSLIGYLAVIVHSVFSGTDSSLPSVMVLYISTFLVTVFLMVYWLVMLAQKNRLKKAPVKANAIRQNTTR